MSKILEQFKESIRNLELDELKELKVSLITGFNDLIALIDNRIRQLEDSHHVCAVCGTPLSEVSEPLVMEFGKRSLRKRAYFCGLDCLDYFLSHYKVRKRSNEQIKKQIYF